MLGQVTALDQCILDNVIVNSSSQRRGYLVVELLGQTNVSRWVVLKEKGEALIKQSTYPVSSQRVPSNPG